MIKLMIVDDDPFMRVYIRNIVSTDGDIEVVGEANNGQEAVDMVQKVNPDVISMDLEMPLMNGLEATKEIIARCPRPIIMVSAFTQEESESTLEAMKLGASDYVSKSSDFLGLDIAHIEIALKEKVREWSKRSPAVQAEKRRENLNHLESIQQAFK